MDADSEFITAVDVLPANGDEAANATSLIQQEEQAQGNDIEALSIDGIGFRGDLIEQWTDPRGVESGSDRTADGADRPRRGFHRRRSRSTPPEQELTCPAGQTTQTRERNANDTGWKYRFSARQCAGCPLRGQCLAKPETTTGGRTVIKNDYEATYRAAREKAKTPRYQEVSPAASAGREEAGGDGPVARWPACALLGAGEGLDSSIVDRMCRQRPPDVEVAGTCHSGDGRDSGPV